MKRALLAALVLSAASLAVAQDIDQEPLQAIDDCISRLDPQIDVGYERIAARCPDLVRRLENSAWSAWLPATWKESRNDLSAGGLRELRALVSRELQTRVAERAPRVESLYEILEGLGDTARERTGFWARFKAWLRSLFEQRGTDESPGWLARLIDRVGLSQAIIEIVTYVSIGIVIALAFFIIYNELRVAGVFNWRRRRAERAGPTHPSERARISWKDVERADLTEKPRLLLELVAWRLMELRRLPPAASLTARELAREAELPDQEDRARLDMLAATAERVRFSGEPVAQSALEKAFEQGRELLARLERNSPAPQAASSAS